MSASIVNGAGEHALVSGGVVHPRGFRVASCALQPEGGAALLLADNGRVPAAGVFTQCKVRAAPVRLSESALARSGGHARAVLLNRGQANASTGQVGVDDAQSCVHAVASELACEHDDVLLQSTGVIGSRIDAPQLAETVPELVSSLTSKPSSSFAAADIIRTTDTISKEAAVTTQAGELGEVRVGGIAKGSGMIHPNMGTMLSVITCDAAVEPRSWQSMLKRAVNLSFNQVTVDGCTSTNDTVMALAGGEVSSLDDKEGAKLQDALTAVCTALAKSIAWDGEGAGVLVEVIARNGRTGSEARAAARAVAESHLVKAAVHGRDANWGRVVAAAGNAGVAMDQAAMGTKMAGYTLLEKGNVTATAERESAVARAIRSAFVDRNTVTIEVDLAAGKSSGMAWTCDLSAEYVSINADYRS